MRRRYVLGCAVAWVWGISKVKSSGRSRAAHYRDAISATCWPPADICSTLCPCVAWIARDHAWPLHPARVDLLRHHIGLPPRPGPRAWSGTVGFLSPRRPRRRSRAACSRQTPTHRHPPAPSGRTTPRPRTQPRRPASQCNAIYALINGCSAAPLLCRRRRNHQCAGPWGHMGEHMFRDVRSCRRALRP
jgi:hypothetical protein